MKLGILSPFTSTALGLAFAFANGSMVVAQDAVGLPGNPRTVNERVVTQTPTPPPATSDPVRTADGKIIPGVPSTGGAIDPARALGTTGPQRGAAMDPAMRLDPVTRLPVPVSYPAGMEVAILVEHALGMAIEGSALRVIAEQTATAAADKQPSQRLMDHANKQMIESQRLLGQAAADGPGLTASPQPRRFLSAANLYIATLAGLENSGPAEKAQVALINHAVKEALDADHIRQMSRSFSGSLALEQLMKHATVMKSEGTQTLIRLAGNGRIDPAAPSSIATLAIRGREVLEAADQLNLTVSNPTVLVPPAGIANPAAVTPVGPNPGRFQDDRPKIIGGTYGTGSAGTGTTTGGVVPSNGTVPKIQNAGSPVPVPGSSSPGSTGGLSPR